MLNLQKETMNNHSIFIQKRQIIEEFGDPEIILVAANLTINDTGDLDMTLEEIQDYIFPKSWTWVLILLHTVVFVIGLLGNIMVCVAVYRNHSMRTVTNYFIVNLAVADALVILFCLPFSVVWDVTSTWFFGTGMCKFVLYVQNVSVTVSILTLAFISGDRWYAICYPLKFNSTTARAKTAIFIIWVIAITCGADNAEIYRNRKSFFSLNVQCLTDAKLKFLDVVDRWPGSTHDATIFANSSIRARLESGEFGGSVIIEIPEPIYLVAVPFNETYIYFTQCQPTWSPKTDTIFFAIKTVLFYVAPLILMSIAYTQIIKVLWTSGKAPHQTLSSQGSIRSSGGGQPINSFAMNMNATTEGQLKSRRNAAKMLVAVVIMFVICFLPVHLLSILRLTIAMKNSDLNRAFSLISHWLCYANSAVNPIIYNFMSDDSVPYTSINTQPNPGGCRRRIFRN